MKTISAILFALLFAVTSINARIWCINPDGTGDAPTIRAGIDSSAAGDTVLVACGTYYEHDLDMKSGVCLKGESSWPPCVTIDAQQKGKLITCYLNQPSTLIEDLMMMNASQYGMTCSGPPSPMTGPTVRNCVFVHNESPTIDVMYSTPNIYNCVFYGNYGGATIVSVYGGSDPLISNCTFINNSNGIVVGIEGAARIKNCIIAYCQGWSLWSADEMSWYSISCSNLYANGSANIDNATVVANPSCFIVDPQFCGIPGSHNYYLQSDSPCAPGNHPGGYECGLIGALPVLCGTTPTEKKSWGGIKSLYR